MEQKEINIDKLVAGDERAFIAFIEYHSSALYHYTFNILHQKECAEEVVSDVFLEVWKHRKKLGKIENIKGWLYRILYNKSISFLRKDSVEYTNLSFDEVEDFTFELVPSQEEKLIWEEKLSILNAAIASLPSKSRHVLYLVKIERLSYAEVADLLHISVKTVSNHLTYAMKKLMETLKDEVVLWLFLLPFFQ